MNIEMRKLTENSELQEMERLEGAVWSAASVIPFHMTLTMHKFGGIFLGAFDGDKMIGFLYSFPGYTDGEFHLASHMLGFLPDYRKAGLGVQMKWLQRDEALKLGYQKITWTYDPLETVNAYLNIAKLGGVVKKYLPNCYGDLSDEMNIGLPTDRFLVEWLITSERVKAYREQQVQKESLSSSIPSVLSYRLDENRIPVPVEVNLQHTSDKLQVAVPAHFQAVKRQDMSIAQAWREVTREVFTHYFAQGYVVVDVIRSESEPVVIYLLQKGADLT